MGGGEGEDPGHAPRILVVAQHGGDVEFHRDAAPSWHLRDIGQLDRLELKGFLHTLPVEAIREWMSLAASVLRPGGILRVVVPYYLDWWVYFRNPETRSVISEEYFEPWCRNVPLDPEERRVEGSRPFVREIAEVRGHWLKVDLRRASDTP